MIRLQREAWAKRKSEMKLINFTKSKNGHIRGVYKNITNDRVFVHWLSDDEMKRLENNEMIEHAKRELNLILKQCTDEEGIAMQKQINEDILNIITMFANQGHSGGSASYAIPIINKLLKYEFITPLTGADDEWVEPINKSDEIVVNKRQHNIFKNLKTGETKYMDGIIFSDNGGKSWFTNNRSQVPVSFPLKHLPKPIYKYIIYDKNDDVIFETEDLNEWKEEVKKRG